MHTIKMFFFYIALSALLACNATIKHSNIVEPSPYFQNYWFNSQAEITSYKLKQARYGEIRDGVATLIFVTEPFNTSKQVKSDNGIGINVESVLKLNQIRKFNTGIYPYSTMTSSFTPIHSVHAGSTIKLTNSVQEWCGHAYMQMNKKFNHYNVQSYSYFESEGDEKFKIDSELLEDEIFSIIKINPEGLPVGDIEVIPSLVYLRFMHKKLKPYKAKTSLESLVIDNKKAKKYIIQYMNLDREFSIIFLEDSPYSIEEWQEKYTSFNGALMTTSATKETQKLIDYWNKNKNSDEYLFEELHSF